MDTNQIIDTLITSFQDKKSDDDEIIPMIKQLSLNQ
jgi:hypothetical protein